MARLRGGRGASLLPGCAICRFRRNGDWFRLLVGSMIAIDEMLKGFSLRAFSATTFGLLLGTFVALLNVDKSGLFENVDEKPTRWLIRLSLFLAAFGYIGIILAMRSNKEDFSLIIPRRPFRPPKPARQSLPAGYQRDHRWTDRGPDRSKFSGRHYCCAAFLVLRELQQIADSNDSIKRARGRRGPKC